MTATLMKYCRRSSCFLLELNNGKMLLRGMTYPSHLKALNICDTIYPHAYAFLIANISAGSSSEAKLLMLIYSMY